MIMMNAKPQQRRVVHERHDVPARRRTADSSGVYPSTSTAALSTSTKIPKSRAPLVLVLECTPFHEWCLTTSLLPQAFNSCREHHASASKPLASGPVRGLNFSSFVVSPRCWLLLLSAALGIFFPVIVDLFRYTCSSRPFVVAGAAECPQRLLERPPQ